MIGNDYPVTTIAEERLLSRAAGLYLKATHQKGRGLFCKELIAAADVIEVSPALVFHEVDAASIDKTFLYNYYFSAAFLPDETMADFDITDKGNSGIFALGALSFCNHTEDPNAKIEKLMDQDGVYFILRALRNIPAQEEITISYGKTWFEVVS